MGVNVTRCGCAVLVVVGVRHPVAFKSKNGSGREISRTMIDISTLYYNVDQSPASPPAKQVHASERTSARPANSPAIANTTDPIT
jgi:hypothetical protein